MAEVQTPEVSAKSARQSRVTYDNCATQ